uniref:Defensin n=1 Tax=Bombus hypocrita sapporensis TaxID=1079038 RepID=B6DVR9_BOMHP|nr:defensin [Bombus hypocrita sapporensis]
MVKVYFLVALLFVAVAAIMAAPVEEEYELLEQAGIEERADRQRRVTCDLLSIKGVAEHSALCRKTDFKDLWDKRFG